MFRPQRFSLKHLYSPALFFTAQENEIFSVCRRRPGLSRADPLGSRGTSTLSFPLALGLHQISKVRGCLQEHLCCILILQKLDYAWFSFLFYTILSTLNVFSCISLHNEDSHFGGSVCV